MVLFCGFLRIIVKCLLCGGFLRIIVKCLQDIGPRAWKVRIWSFIDLGYHILAQGLYLIRALCDIGPRAVFEKITWRCEKYWPKGCFYEKAYHILAQGLKLRIMCNIGAFLWHLECNISKLSSCFSFREIAWCNIRFRW
jgi:hypothetical protein